ncbi:hypothetical protein FHS18_002881 [Paenibacillus phyllosphaerae]|uniref:Lipoprotein n=1 Tax=Paenibacillus phyllosphaerae TaxID=274593 RepID=A0A7W5AYH4_9BACL|nr:hypothetical protein [Paenibacillus phyllosphaerae]MBB3110814.1 hypothetical protein [Paenibacillus phyllosphaerae]
MKWALGIILLCVIVLAGCTDNSPHNGVIIKKEIYPELMDPDNEYVYEFRGHSSNWEAVFFIYKTKTAERAATKTVLVYTGKDSLPTGELSAPYIAQDITGGGSLTIDKAPEQGIYVFGPSAFPASPDQESPIQLLVHWSTHAEVIELKPAT